MVIYQSTLKLSKYLAFDTIQMFNETHRKFYHEVHTHNGKINITRFFLIENGKDPNEDFIDEKSLWNSFIDLIKNEITIKLYEYTEKFETLFHNYFEKDLDAVSLEIFFDNMYITKLKKHISACTPFTQSSDKNNPYSFHIILFLNNVSTGGVIHFPYHNIRVEPFMYNMVIFPDSWNVSYTECSSPCDDIYQLHIHCKLNKRS